MTKSSINLRFFQTDGSLLNAILATVMGIYRILIVNYKVVSFHLKVELILDYMR